MYTNSKGDSVPDKSVFFPSDVRRDVVAHLQDYVTLQAQIWPEVLAGGDAVYNRSKAMLDMLKGGI